MCFLRVVKNDNSLQLFTILENQGRSSILAHRFNSKAKKKQPDTRSRPIKTAHFIQVPIYVLDKMAPTTAESSLFCYCDDNIYLNANNRWFRCFIKFYFVISIHLLEHP